MCIQQESLQHLKSVLMSDNAHNKRSTAGADQEVEEGGGELKLGLVWPCGVRSARDLFFANI